MSQNIYTPYPSTNFFVDSNYLKANLPISDNVEDKFLTYHVKIASDMFIMPILGSTLYMEMGQMVQEFMQSATTIPDIYLYLITNFIQPILASAVAWRLLPMLSLQIDNKGIMRSKTDYSEQADLKDVMLIAETFRSNANFYAQRLINYLIDNVTIYLQYENPQLGTTSNGADLFYPERSSYSNSGIYLPRLGSQNPWLKGRGWGLSLENYNDLFGGR